MRIAYLECQMGISGDMTLGALIDAGVDVEQIRAGIASLQLAGVELHVEKIIKNGFSATAVTVNHPEQHAHRHLADIMDILDRSSEMTAPQKEIASNIFKTIAAAEAKVHGSTIDQVHFHEVGAIDSIVDIIGAAIGFDLLQVDQVVCSALPTGQGVVHIDHGICPVPAPGTAEILKGIPLQDVPVDAELTTPTGAAIAAVLADRFSFRPPMTIEQIGYGAGTKTFPQRANLLRLFVGTAAVDAETEWITMLETNLDDTSPEVIGYTRELLERQGALDVFTSPIQMKKNRPGVMLSLLCQPQQTNQLKQIMFEQTGTLGIRESSIQRTILAREIHSIETVYGMISGKVTRPAGERAWFQPEFADCAAVAAEHGVTLREVYRTAQSQFDQINATETIENSEQPHRHDHDHDHDHDHG